MKEFMIVAPITGAILIILWLLWERKYRRMAKALGARRASPTHDEFIALLAKDCEADVADFLWDQLYVFYKPTITPHPDDNFVTDLPIDPDEPEYWVLEFFARNGLAKERIGAWPDESVTTIRNLAIWLSGERKRLAHQS